MRKKIIAGVAAMLMVASCIPANTNFGFSFNAPITASAADQKVELDNVTITLNSKTGNIEITPNNLYDFMGVSNTVSTLNINVSNIESDIKSLASGNLSDKKVILKAPKTKLNKNVNLSKINFTDSIITDIGENFASSCTTLQTVSFGSKITTIGKSAFSGCSHLQGTSGTTLDLSNIVTIEESAFASDSEIQSITFGNNLISIGNSAFLSNIALKALILPANLQSLGNSAFKSCSKLESVKFASNSNLTNIGISVFESCTNLTAVLVNGDNYNRLPDGTSGLKCGEKIFKGCESLQNFTWPSSFKWIPEDAFSGCTALTQFKFDGGATGSSCETIYKNAFNGCKSLVSIELPNANNTLGDQVFYNCNKLEKVVVSDNLTSVGKSAFAGCWVLTLYPRADAKKTKNKIVLPSTWKVIAGSTFSNCDGVTQVDISPVTDIGESAFSSCDSLQSITIPDAVKILYDNTFSDCIALKDVVVSKNLEVLGMDADGGNPAGCVFKNCKSLETFTPSNATKMAYTIQFPATLGGVQKSSFENCPSFKYINFAKNSQFGVLGENAFYKCTGLLGSNEGGNANNTIYMPANVKVINKNAFAECTSLKKIEFLGNVSTIGISAFQKCTALEDVIMNDTIEQVRDSAFADCTSLKTMPHTKAGKIAFSNIDTINASTFKNCTSLTEARIPKNVTIIGNSAFAGCKAMTRVLWESGSALATIGSSAFSGDEKLAVFTSSTSGKDSIFPDSLTMINSSAFTKTALTKITIGTPANGDKILLGSSAFSDNKALETVDLSKSNIIEIPKSCFSNDTNLKTVLLPESSLTKLDDNAFYRCNFLHTFGTASANKGEYTIPESLTSIGSKVFEDNFCMQVLNIPESATFLSMSMLNFYIKEEDIEKYNYTPLETINVNKNNPNYKSVDGILYSKDMTTLYWRPYNKKEAKFVVPDSVKYIEQCACVNRFLQNVVLNNNLQSIADKAFNDCHRLESVDFGKNGTVSLGKTVFAKNKGKITLYGTTGSTAETYANSNTSKVTFINNDLAASKLEILSKNGKVINGNITIAFTDKSYAFGCKQTTAKGKDASDNLIWSSSNSAVAVIDNTGKATFKGKGTTTITVTNANGTAVSTVKLTLGDKTTFVDDLPGDINGDGKVNVNDITKIAAHIKGKSKLDSVAQKRADVSGDGKISVTDITKIAAHIKGKSLLK